MNNRVFFLFFPVAVIGCGESTQQAMPDEFLAMEKPPFIVNVDPGKYSLNSLYDDGTVSQLLRSVDEGDYRSKYLLGVLLNNDISIVQLEDSIYDGRSLLLDSWKNGVVDAGYSLYLIYRSSGDSDSLALEYLASSAEYGYVKSQRSLGYCYSGVVIDDLCEVDYSKSMYWFRKAAEEGDALSALSLSGMYEHGQAGEKNYSEAFYWAFLSKDMMYDNNSFSFNRLARYYEEGIGTDIDLVQAYKYYDLLSPGSAPDKARLEEQMTPEQIREAIRLSREWQEEHNIFVPSYYGLEYQEDGSFQ